MSVSSTAPGSRLAGSNYNNVIPSAEQSPVRYDCNDDQLMTVGGANDSQRQKSRSRKRTISSLKCKSALSSTKSKGAVEFTPQVNFSRPSMPSSVAGAASTYASAKRPKYSNILNNSGTKQISGKPSSTNNSLAQPNRQKIG